MPPIVLQITVDDKGTPVIKQFSGEVAKAGTAINQGATQQFQHATRATDQWAASLGSLAKQTATVALGFAGFQGIAGAVSNITGTLTSFDKELANVNTVLVGSNLTIKDLEAQLLRLPPAFGSSTQLAQGLYQALSAGVPAAKAVAFIGENAKLAQAGLTDLSTTVKVSTAVMDSFGLEADQVSHIADVLFNVVRIGKAEFGPLASSIANVFPLARNLGISFEETAATVTTLTSVFPSVSEAVTGFRSLLSNVTANMDNFRAAGINVQEVIGKRGVTGLIEELARVTGQSAEVLRARFVPDVEGGTAALALMGPQLQRQRENVQTFGNTAGAATEAFIKNQDSIDKGLERISNAIGRVVNGSGLASYFKSLLQPVEQWVTLLAQGGEASIQFAMITTQAVGSVTNSLGLLAQGSIAVVEGWNRIGQGVGTVATLYFDALSAMTSAARALGLVNAEVAEQSLVTLAKQSLPFREFTIQMGAAADQWQQTRASIAAGQAAIEANLVRAQTQAVTFASSLHGVGTAGKEAATQIAQAGVVSLNVIDTANAKTVEAIRQSAEVADAANQGMVRSTQSANAAITQNTEKATSEAAEAFTKLGLSTRESLQRTATTALETFKKILGSGEATPQQLLAEWQKVLKQLNDAGFQTLPPEWQAVNNRMQEIARKAGVELPKPYKDAFGQIVTEGKKTVTEIDKLWEEFYQIVGPDGRPVRGAEAAAREIGRKLGGLRPEVQATGAAIEEGLGGGAEAGRDRALVALDQTAQAARQVQAVFVQQFADTREGLLDQLRQARQERSNLAFASEIGAPGFRDFTRKRLDETIDLLTKKLADLGVVVGDITKNPFAALQEQLPPQGSAPSGGTTAPGIALGGGGSGGVISPGLLGGGMSAPGYHFETVGGVQILVPNRPGVIGPQVPGRAPVTPPTGFTLPTTPGQFITAGGFTTLLPTAPSQPPIALQPGQRPGSAPSSQPVATGGTGAFTVGPSGGIGAGAGGAPERGGLLGGADTGVNTGIAGITRGTRQVTIQTMNVMAPGLTRGDAQRFVQDIAPALNEALRRGEIG